MSLPVNSPRRPLPNPLSARPRSLHHPSFLEPAQNNELARCYETHQTRKPFPLSHFPNRCPWGEGVTNLQTIALQTAPNPICKSHLCRTLASTISTIDRANLLFSVIYRNDAPPGGYHNQDSLSQRKEVWQGGEKVVSVILSEAIEDCGPAGKALSSLLLALIQLFIY